MSVELTNNIDTGHEQPAKEQAATCRRFRDQRVIVMAAPNGARRSKADHAGLPLTADELAVSATRLLRAGVAVLHLHVRDERGAHTLDPACYRAAIEAIRQQTGNNLILQVTTEAAGRYNAAEQQAVVRALRPEAVSIALRELCPDTAAECEAARFFTWVERERIWPQYIVYSADELARFDYLRRRGLFATSRPFCLLVLGRYNDAVAGEPRELDDLLQAADCTDFPWAVCCFGRQEHAVMLAALQRGGHVRMGFENNLLLADGRTAADNAELVSQFRDAAAASPRVPASADEIRDWLSAAGAGH